MGISNDLAKFSVWDRVLAKRIVILIFNNPKTSNEIIKDLKLPQSNFSLAKKTLLYHQIISRKERLLAQNNKKDKDYLKSLTAWHRDEKFYSTKESLQYAILVPKNNSKTTARGFLEFNELAGLIPEFVKFIPKFEKKIGRETILGEWNELFIKYILWNPIKRNPRIDAELLDFVRSYFIDIESANLNDLSTSEEIKLF